MRETALLPATLALACVFSFATGMAGGAEPPVGDHPRVWTEPLRDQPGVGDNEEMRALGERIFNRACFYCHGENGDGDGAGARLLPIKPRDFTQGQYKLRTTPSGFL